MVKLVEFSLEDGGDVVVEVDDGRSGPALVSVGGLPEKAQASLEDAVARIKPIARNVVGAFKDLGPEGIQIELGVKFSAELGAILAKTSGEGGVKVTLTWKKGDAI